MSDDSTKDPRTEMVETKYFSLHPKPLERWLWQQGLSQTAERVFWLHWEEGMRNRDWCSEIPIKRVARDCGIDPSSVTRAYQVLKVKGLLLRQDPGRDTTKPFQQATAITEVRLPHAFLTELRRCPNRPLRERRPEPNSSATEPPRAMSQASPVTAIVSVKPDGRRPTRDEIRALWQRATELEKQRFYIATRDRTRCMDFDSDTRLTAADQAEITAQLAQTADAQPAMTTPVSRSKMATVKPRRLSALEIARARFRLLEGTHGESPMETLRQVIWAVEEGALSRFAPGLAINIALKKIRQGAWTKPNRMPPNWLDLSRTSAAPETCGAA